MSSIDKKKKRRTTVRSSFTKTVNVLKEELSKTEVDCGLLSDKLAKSEDLIQELRNLDSECMDILLDQDVSQEDLDLEQESCEEYSDQFVTIKRLVNECLNGMDLQSKSESSNPTVVTTGKRYKLPKIEIRKFDGELINWLSFWSQFKKIHEDEELGESDKFHYLLQSMQSGTRARELVESYPLTSANYKKAVSALEQRFGRKELLTEVYVRELLKLIITNVRSSGRDKLPLTKLFDKIETYLRALESMGIIQEENAAWLYPMVESSLSEEILKAWQRSSFFNNEDVKKPRLSCLIEFLRREVEGEERLKLARKGFEVSPLKDGHLKPKQTRCSAPTATGLFTLEAKCIFCDKSHNSSECYSARLMSLKEKTNKLREKKCCLKCFKPGHFARCCKQFVRCYVCSGPHPVLLCPELPLKKVVSEDKKSEVVQSTIAKPACASEVALMTLEVEIAGNKAKKKVRALLDCGSQRSYILKSTAATLGLKGISTEDITHTLFGGLRTESKCHNKYLVKLCGPNKNVEAKYEFEFLDQDKICGEIPRIPKGPLLKELKKHKIWFSDMGSDCPEIELLIGSDIYGKIITGDVRQLAGGLTAIKTKLGWTMCGQHNASSQPEKVISSILATNLVIKEMKVADLWRLETIGITDEGQSLSKTVEDELAQEQFLRCLSRSEDGRYSVGLPWTQKYPPDIPSNRHVAEMRLFSTTRKLIKEKKYEDYDLVFRDWLDEDIMERIPETDKPKDGYYLPHHPVLKPESLTTKIRPVFDASCKSDRAPSLNDCLFSGPNLIEQIPAILLRFREKAIGVTSDIRRAFLQIELKKEDRDYLKFLWWENDKIEVFRHKRVVFGVTCSPYLLGAVICYHLSNVSQDLRAVSDKLAKSFYIDNCVTSVEDCRELIDFIKKSTEILADAKMDLRMWCYGPFDIKDRDVFYEDMPEQNLSPIIPILGLKWDRSDDTLIVCSKPTLKLENPTKRQILSLTQGIFDPLGFLSPVLLPAKLLIQQAWATKSNWDSPLPTHIQNKFMKWCNELEVLSEIKVPRRVGYGSPENWTIHVFCDASLEAYATVIFLCCDNYGEITIRFLGSKSRVSPLKRLTIPRLELLACLLGVRFAKYITEALNFPLNVVKFWSDSTTAISWILRNDKWGTFVGNRVREILTMTEPSQWLYIPGKLNPADLASRGCSPQQLLRSRWWEGPEFLKCPPEAWPNLEFIPDEESIAAEMKRTKVTDLTVKIEQSEWFERFSNFEKIIRIFCWVLRFVNKMRKRSTYSSDTLSVEEKSEAENTLWSLEQKKYLPEKGDSVKGLLVVKDDKEVIRVKTKIIERDDELCFIYPILLPSKHHLTDCLIRQYHLNNCHAGVQILAAKLREKYWIISAKRNIRNNVSKCVICKRFTSKSLSTPPIHLPLDRVRDSAVFEVTGVDLCGPLFLKPKGKAWIVLYTCAVYRAIHLELVTSLSTESFLQSLRRFIARRGRPSTIYSDNGTNFTGASNVLKQVDWKRITEQEYAPIKWKFIPPTAAWWGGWWERLIRSVKTLLVRILGRSSLNYEELLTIICDIESTINSRPLTYISDGTEDLVPLTPSLFLHDIKQIGVPDLDTIDSNKLNVRLNYCETLRKEIRSRFRKEYLSQLVQKASVMSHELKVGDVVLIGLDNKKRLTWPMGKVEKIFPSRDGFARVAKVKTTTGSVIRPVQKLYLLEVSTAGDPILQFGPEKRSRYGRLLKPTEKLL